MTQQEFIEKFDLGNKFDEKEIRNIIHFDDELLFIHEDEGEDRRWTATVSVIMQAGNRYFLFNYERGLTEVQEDMYDSQPREILAGPTYTRIVTEIFLDTEWTFKDDSGRNFRTSKSQGASQEIIGTSIE